MTGADTVAWPGPAVNAELVVESMLVVTVVAATKIFKVIFNIFFKK